MANSGGKPALEPQTLHEQLVDAMYAIAGAHPGYRPIHAKGIVCEGMFRPATGAPSLSRAPHLRGGAIPVTVRFSDNTGIPAIPDSEPSASPRGMAIRFHLRDGSITDVVGQSYNGFPVRNAEEFLGLLGALTAPAQDAALEEFLSSHPAARSFVEAPKPAPRSFATAAYHGINALRFTNREGTRRCGRYRIVPVAGESYLEAEEVTTLPANFMFDEIKARLSRSPVEFRLMVQLAEEDDPVDDATARWPENRPLADLGLLTLTKRVIDSDAVQRALAFDPGRLTDGIEASEDPLIATRSAVYAIAARRRSE